MSYCQMWHPSMSRNAGILTAMAGSAVPVMCYAAYCALCRMHRPPRHPPSRRAPPAHAALPPRRPPPCQSRSSRYSRSADYDDEDEDEDEDGTDNTDDDHRSESDASDTALLPPPPPHTKRHSRRRRASDDEAEAALAARSLTAMRQWSGDTAARWLRGVGVSPSDVRRMRQNGLDGRDLYAAALGAVRGRRAGRGSPADMRGADGADVWRARRAVRLRGGRDIAPDVWPHEDDGTANRAASATDDADEKDRHTAGGAGNGSNGAEKGERAVRFVHAAQVTLGQLRCMPSDTRCRSIHTDGGHRHTPDPNAVCPATSAATDAAAAAAVWLLLHRLTALSRSEQRWAVQQLQPERTGSTPRTGDDAARAGNAVWARTSEVTRHGMPEHLSVLAEKVQPMVALLDGFIELLRSPELPAVMRAAQSSRIESQCLRTDTSPPDDEEDESVSGALAHGDVLALTTRMQSQVQLMAQVAEQLPGALALPVFERCQMVMGLLEGLRTDAAVAPGGHTARRMYGAIDDTAANRCNTPHHTTHLNDNHNNNNNNNNNDDHDNTTNNNDTHGNIIYTRNDTTDDHTNHNHRDNGIDMLIDAQRTTDSDKKNDHEDETNNSHKDNNAVLLSRDVTESGGESATSAASAEATMIVRIMTRLREMLDRVKDRALLRSTPRARLSAARDMLSELDAMERVSVQLRDAEEPQARARRQNGAGRRGDDGAIGVDGATSVPHLDEGGSSSSSSSSPSSSWRMVCQVITSVRTLLQQVERLTREECDLTSLCATADAAKRGTLNDNNSRSSGNRSTDRCNTTDDEAKGVGARAKPSAKDRHDGRDSERAVAMEEQLCRMRELFASDTFAQAPASARMGLLDSAEARVTAALREAEGQTRAHEPDGSSSSSSSNSNNSSSTCRTPVRTMLRDMIAELQAQRRAVASGAANASSVTTASDAAGVDPDASVRRLQHDSHTPEAVLFRTRERTHAAPDHAAAVVAGNNPMDVNDSREDKSDTDCVTNQANRVDAAMDKSDDDAADADAAAAAAADEDEDEDEDDAAVGMVREMFAVIRSEQFAVADAATQRRVAATLLHTARDTRMRLGEVQDGPARAAVLELLSSLEQFLHSVLTVTVTVAGDRADAAPALPGRDGGGGHERRNDDAAAASPPTTNRPATAPNDNRTTHRNSHPVGDSNDKDNTITGTQASEEADCASHGPAQASAPSPNGAPGDGQPTEHPSPSWTLFSVARTRLTEVLERLGAPAIRQAPAERRSGVVASVVPLLRELVPTLPLLQPSEQEQLMALMESIHRLLVSLAPPSDASAELASALRSDRHADDASTVDALGALALNARDATTAANSNNNNNNRATATNSNNSNGIDDNNDVRVDAGWEDVNDGETSDQRRDVTRLHAVLCGVQAIMHRIQGQEWRRRDAAGQRLCAREWVRELQRSRDRVERIIAASQRAQSGREGSDSGAFAGAHESVIPTAAPLLRVIDHLMAELQPLAGWTNNEPPSPPRTSRAHDGADDVTRDDSADGSSAHDVNHPYNNSIHCVSSDDVPRTLLQSEGVDALMTTLRTVWAITTEPTFAAEQGPQAVLLLLRRVLDDTEAAGVRWRQCAEATQLIRNILTRVDEACQHRLSSVRDDDDEDENADESESDDHTRSSSTSDNNTNSSNHRNNTTTTTTNNTTNTSRSNNTNSHHHQSNHGNGENDLRNAVRALCALATIAEDANTMLSEGRVADVLLTVSYALRESMHVSRASVDILMNALTRLRQLLAGRLEMTAGLTDCIAAVEHQLSLVRAHDVDEEDEDADEQEDAEQGEEELMPSRPDDDGRVVDHKAEGGEEEGKELVTRSRTMNVRATGTTAEEQVRACERSDAAFVEDDAEGSVSGE